MLEREKLLLEILLSADALADKLLAALEKQTEAIQRQERLAELSGFLLDLTSKKLLERAIHLELDAYERRQKNRDRWGAGGFEIRQNGRGRLTAK